MLLASLALLTQPESLDYRWIYYATNFYREEAVAQADTIVDRAAAAGYNGIVFVDSKIESAWPYPDFYVKNVRKFLDHASEKHIMVIPAVLSVGWADAMLSHNPNLVEAMPCRNVAYRVKNHQLVLETDPNPLYQNGGFEASHNDQFVGFSYQDAPGRTTFVDHDVHHGGTSSMRIENPGIGTDTNGNARIVQDIHLQPWHQYRFSAWIKTQDFDRAGDVRAVVLDDKGQALSFTDGGISPTQDWKKLTVVFNSQDHSQAKLYFGVWSGNKGKLWIDDASLEDAGLLNVARRPGCPLTVKRGDTVLTEGTDVEKIVDPKFGNTPWNGEYDFEHEPPVPAVGPNSSLREGDLVSLSYYAAITTDQGKAAICLSEPETRQIMDQELAAAKGLFGSQGFFFSHDEIRVMDWCAACQARNLTPGEILAADVRASALTVKKLAPQAKIFIWSDMFDPNHNAVDDYYLCHGSVRQSWKGLPKDAVIVNWNSGKQAESLKFFADQGFGQILAGYYDGDVQSIRPWMAAARATGSLKGVMYTTWVGNYDQLEAFAKAAWGP